MENSKSITLRMESKYSLPEQISVRFPLKLGFLDCSNQSFPSKVKVCFKLLIERASMFLKWVFSPKAPNGV